MMALACGSDGASAPRRSESARERAVAVVWARVDGFVRGARGLREYTVLSEHLSESCIESSNPISPSSGTPLPARLFFLTAWFPSQRTAASLTVVFQPQKWDSACIVEIFVRVYCAGLLLVVKKLVDS